MSAGEREDGEGSTDTGRMKALESEGDMSYRVARYVDRRSTGDDAKRVRKRQR